MSRAGLLNMFLRGLTMVSRSLLVFFLARFFTPAELGLYGLFMVTAAWSLLALGMDFYTYTTRELLARDKPQWPILLRNQFVFHLALYFIVLPALGGIFLAGILPVRVIFWFYVLQVLEHLAHECFRLLEALSRPIQATLLSFVRNGVWVYVLVVAMILRPEARQLEVLFAHWTAGVAVSLIVAAYFLRDLDWKSTLAVPIDWPWIWKGLSVCLPFLGATLCLQGITVSTRYMLNHFWGQESVGFYTFYAGAAQAVQSFAETGVVVFLYPKIVRAYQLGEFVEYWDHVRTLARRLSVTLAGLVTLAAVGIFPLLWLLQRPEYTAHLPTYWVLLASIAATVLASVPHYALYAQRRDGLIIFATIGGFVVALVLGFLLVPPYGQVGAALATTGAMAFIGLAKLAALLAIRSQAPQSFRVS